MKTSDIEINRLLEEVNAYAKFYCVERKYWDGSLFTLFEVGEEERIVTLYDNVNIAEKKYIVTYLNGLLNAFSLKKEPIPGAVGICSVGLLGMITSNGKKEIEYSDGNKGECYYGVQLTNNKATVKGDEYKVEVGKQWTSKNPKVVGYIEDMDSFMEALDE